MTDDRTGDGPEGTDRPHRSAVAAAIAAARARAQGTTPEPPEVVEETPATEPEVVSEAPVAEPEPQPEAVVEPEPEAVAVPEPVADPGPVPTTDDVEPDLVADTTVAPEPFLVDESDDVELDEPVLGQPEPDEPDPDVPDPDEPSVDEAAAADLIEPDEVAAEDEPDLADATVVAEASAVPEAREEPPGEEPVGEAPEEEPVAPLHAVDPDVDEAEHHEQPSEDASAAVPPPLLPFTEGDGGEPPHRRRSWPLLVAVAVLGLLYVGGWLLTGMRMPADASVGGVDVGGMSPGEARSAVAEGLADGEDTPVALAHEDETFEVVPADVSLELDAAASVRQVGGVRSWDPRDMAALFFGSHDHDPVVTADEEALESAVTAIADEVDVPVTEALITFPKAEPTTRSPEAGLVVRKGDTAEAVKAAWLVETEPVEVPTAVVEPAVDEEGLQAAVTEVAEPAVSGPVDIEVGDTTVELPVTAYAPALTVEPVEGTMTPVIDPEELAEPLTDATTGIGEKAVDATVEIRDGKPEVVPGKEGVGLQPEEMAEKLVPVLTSSGDERAVQIEAKVVEPLFTTEDAKNLKITEKISEFSTNYPHAEYRNVNQSRAAALIDGVLLKPGETFSFNDTVGERTAANGFTTGSVINGGRFRDELGGGVSQVVTTTYNAAFFAGLQDVEHHPHAFYIDRYPAGREATVYFGSLDLRFKNNLQSGVLIKASVNRSAPGGQGTTTVQIWGTKEFDVKAGQSERRNVREPRTRYDDADDCAAQAPLRGFDIDIYRTISKGGKVVKRETNTANYQAADRIICGEDPDDD